LRQQDSADFHADLEFKHPHRVPPSYLAKLDACR